MFRQRPQQPDHVILSRSQRFTFSHLLVGIAVTKRTTPSFPRIQANVTSMTLPFAPAIEITWLYFMPYWVTPVSFEPLRLRSPSYVVGIEQVPFKLVQIAFL
ncbi:hypothetical protein BBJ32_07980 [Mycobacterium avium]|nr:hypothetical protein BBJ32_07980 [Mycobacterium avium]